MTNNKQALEALDFIDSYADHNEAWQERYSDEMIDAIETIKEALQSKQWMDIASAPKDGTPILGYAGDVCYVCWRDDYKWKFFENKEEKIVLYFYPTKWCALPSV